MKIYLTLFFLIPNLVSAQLRYDTLLNKHTYQCNCFESLIVQGTPTKIKYKSNYKDLSLFQVKIDTIFYGSDTSKDHRVFIVSNSVETSSRIMQSNLFVLRGCYYCDPRNHIKCRPLLYYEIVEAVRNETMTLEIIKRQDYVPCRQCEAIRPIPKTLFRSKRKIKKWDFEKLNQIEKFVDKKRRRTCYEKSQSIRKIGKD